MDTLSRLPDTDTMDTPLPTHPNDILLAMVLSISSDNAILKTIQEGYDLDPFCMKLKKLPTSCLGLTIVDSLLYISGHLVIPWHGDIHQSSWHTTPWATSVLRNHMGHWEMCTTGPTCARSSKKHTSLPVQHVNGTRLQLKSQLAPYIWCLSQMSDLKASLSISLDLSLKTKVLMRLSWLQTCWEWITRSFLVWALIPPLLLLWGFSMGGIVNTAYQTKYTATTTSFSYPNSGRLWPVSPALNSKCQWLIIQKWTGPVSSQIKQLINPSGSTSPVINWAGYTLSHKSVLTWWTQSTSQQVSLGSSWWWDNHLGLFLYLLWSCLHLVMTQRWTMVLLAPALSCKGLRMTFRQQRTIWCWLKSPKLLKKIKVIQQRNCMQ